MEPSLVDQCQPNLGRANRLYHPHKLRINQSSLVLPLTHLKPVLLVVERVCDRERSLDIAVVGVEAGVVV
jgi:hypothetical protein